MPEIGLGEIETLDWIRQARDFRVIVAGPMRIRADRELDAGIFEQVKELEVLLLGRRCPHRANARSVCGNHCGEAEIAAQAEERGELNISDVHDPEIMESYIAQLNK